MWKCENIYVFISVRYLYIKLRGFLFKKYLLVLLILLWNKTVILHKRLYFCHPLSHILSEDLNAHYAEAVKAFCLSLWSSNSKIIFYTTQKKSFIRKKKAKEIVMNTFLTSFCAINIELKGKVIGRPFKKNEITIGCLCFNISEVWR